MSHQSKESIHKFLTIKRMWKNLRFDYKCRACKFTIKNTKLLWTEVECPRHSHLDIEFLV